MSRIDQDSFIAACSRGDTHAVKKALIKNERRRKIFRGKLKPLFDINGEGRYGNTAFTSAASMGETSTVKLLLENGAHVNISDKSFNTAIIHAVSEGHTETVKALIEAGADVNWKNELGMCALLYAVSRSSPEIVRMLLDAGASTDVTGFSGGTAFHLAAKRGDTEVMQLLFGRGIDIDARNDAGKTALKIASESKYRVRKSSSPERESDYEEIERLLVSNGARQHGLFWD